MIKVKIVYGTDPTGFDKDTWLTFPIDLTDIDLLTIDWYAFFRNRWKMKDHEHLTIYSIKIV